MGVDYRDPEREASVLRALDTIGDVGKSELDDPDRYPKKRRDFSAWLDDTYVALDLHVADVVAGSMGGWIAINYAIDAA